MRAGSELGPTLPLVGRVASEVSVVGVVVSGRISRSNSDPHPQPLPSRLRACPLPASLKMTKPRQAGVWLGRGADRVHGTIASQARPNTLNVYSAMVWSGYPLQTIALYTLSVFGR